RGRPLAPRGAARQDGVLGPERRPRPDGPPRSVPRRRAAALGFPHERVLARAPPQLPPARPVPRARVGADRGGRGVSRLRRRPDRPDDPARRASVPFVTRPSGRAGRRVADGRRDRPVTPNGNPARSPASSAPTTPGWRLVGNSARADR